LFRLSAVFSRAWLRLADSLDADDHLLLDGAAEGLLADDEAGSACTSPWPCLLATSQSKRALLSVLPQVSPLQAQFSTVIPARGQFQSERRLGLSASLVGCDVHAGNGLLAKVALTGST